MSNAWLRSLLLCDDIRLEIGGAMTLVGVYTDQIFVSQESQESTTGIVFPRLGIYAIVAGLTGTTELVWKKTLLYEGVSIDGPPTLEGTEQHDPTADEHRLVTVLSPIAFPKPGRYCLLFTFETKRERRSVEHHFTLAFGQRPPSG